MVGSDPGGGAGAATRGTEPVGAAAAGGGAAAGGAGAAAGGGAAGGGGAAAGGGSVSPGTGSVACATEPITIAASVERTRPSFTTPSSTFPFRFRRPP